MDRRRSWILLSLVAAATLWSVRGRANDQQLAQLTKAPDTIESYWASSKHVVLGDVVASERVTLGPQTLIVRHSIQVIERLSAASQAIPDQIRVAQLAAGTEADPVIFDLHQRFILFLDDWPAAGAYGLVYGGSSGAWRVDRGQVTIPTARLADLSFEGQREMAADALLVKLRAVAAAVAHSPLSVEDRGAIDGYRSVLRNAQNGNGPSAHQLEFALGLVSAVHDALLSTRNGNTVLAAMSNTEFEQIKSRLPGIVLGREEIVFARPDVAFFATLARERGDAADRAFFSALTATYPNSVWPVYVERQTDYSGCTRFGSGTMVGTYRAWADFLRQFAGRYPKAAADHLHQVEEALTNSTCACGASSEVERELSQFTREFPSAASRPAVDQRLQSVRAGHSNIRMMCRSSRSKSK